MPLQINTDSGNIDVADQVVAVIAGSAALDVYGLVGMASRKGIKDGIAELLGQENLARGVEVHLSGDHVNLDLYVIVGYGTKIPEVAHNIQAKVKYVLEDVVGLHVEQVNVYVQGVRVIQ